MARWIITTPPGRLYSTASAPSAICTTKSAAAIVVPILILRWWRYQIHVHAVSTITSSVQMDAIQRCVNSMSVLICHAGSSEPWQSGH